MLSYVLIFTFLVNFALGGYEYEYDGQTALELSVGTPAQGPFLFLWSLPLTASHLRGPTVSNKDVGGVFSPNKSSTFETVKKYGDFIDAVDLVTPKNGPKIKMDITVNGFRPKAKTCYLDLSLGYMGKWSFVESMFRHLGGSRSIGFRIRNSSPNSDRGTLIFADPKPKGCKSWQNYLAIAGSYVQMAFYAKIVEIGKQRRSGLIPMTFTSGRLQLDPKTYAAALTALAARKLEIDCNTTLQIVIRAAADKWTIRPDDYIRRTDGICEFDVGESDNEMIELPLRFLNRRCLVYNFDENVVSIGNLR